MIQATINSFVFLDVNETFVAVILRYIRFFVIEMVEGKRLLGEDLDDLPDRRAARHKNEVV